MNRSGSNVRKSFLRTVRAWPVLLVAALLLAGCGSDDITALPEAQPRSDCPGEGVSRLSVSGTNYVTTQVSDTSPRCDPLVIGIYDDGGGGGPDVSILVAYWNRVPGPAYDDRFAILVPGSPPVTFPVSYTLPGQALVQRAFNLNDPVPIICDAGGGTVTLTAYGGVKGYIQGSYSATGITGDPSCPASLSGSFKVLRVPFDFVFP